MTAPAGPSRAHVAAMFDGIAHRYDVANRVLSLGLDVGWRQRLLARLPESGRGGRRLRVLDVATGTADVALAVARDPRVDRVVGVDVTSQCTILFRLTLFVAGTRRNAGRRQCVPRGRAVVPASRVRESQRVVAASVVARRHCGYAYDLPQRDRVR